MIKRYKSKEYDVDPLFKEKAIGVCLALTFWSTLPIITVFDANQVTEHSVTNAGFLVMTILFIRSTIIDSRREYNKLLKSETELQLKIKERTMELELANEQRLNTYINLTHEIRTPLTLIINYFDKYIATHEHNETLGIIKTNIDKLCTDITNSFNEEKFRNGIIPYNHDQVSNFSKIIKEKIVLFETYSKLKKLFLNSSIEEDIYIKSAPEAIESLMNNLVENAMKYTPEEKNVFISLSSNEDKIFFTVRDEGNGIPEEFHERIFEPYFQVFGKKQSYYGIGIGLSIVNGIVKSLNGTIHFRSKENTGTEFTIELNRFFISKDEEVVDYISQIPININVQVVNDVVIETNKCSVLIVEDHPQMLQSLADELKYHLNVYVADNGRSALQKLNAIPKPDLIISDIMMDDMDGFSFLEAISMNSNFNTIPLIFLTAKTTESDKLKGLDLGAVDYIYKPFKMAELVSKSISIINKKDQQKKYLLNSMAEFLETKLDGTPKINDVKQDKFDYNCFVYKLSTREKELVKYLNEGMTYKKIGDILFISEHTVSTHVQNIYEKTGTKTKNRTDLLNVLFNK